MNKEQLKMTGIICLIVAAVCLFVAIERYHSNASNVDAMNQMMQNSPLGGMSPMGNMRPATPAATIYATLFMVIFGAGGVVALVAASKKP